MNQYDILIATTEHLIYMVDVWFIMISRRDTELVIRVFGFTRNSYGKYV